MREEEEFMATPKAEVIEHKTTKEFFVDAKYSKIAAMWSQILGTSISAKNVAVCMLAVETVNLSGAFNEDTVERAAEVIEDMRSLAQD